MADHLASCRGCAAALESARRVDALLRSRAAPPAPAQFSSRVMSRMRRARWRSEQWLDWGFNVALALAGALVVTGLWMIMRQSGLATVSSDERAAQSQDDAVRALDLAVVPQRALLALAWRRRLRWAERDKTRRRAAGLPGINRGWPAPQPGPERRRARSSRVSLSGTR
jgi:hypothetical protein